MKQRYPLIDFIRSIAIFLMIFFHFSWDLTAFGFLSLDFKGNLFWFHLPRLIVFLFFFCVGVSLRIVHYPDIQWKKLLKRTGILAGLAILVSVATYYVYPSSWIYFGTLHSIAVCSIIAIPFLAHPRLSFLVAIALFIPSAFFDLNLPWFSLPHPSLDYISPFPWTGAMLFGITFSHFNCHHYTKPLFQLPLFRFMSNYSLEIYMVHQPILFGLTFVLSRTFGAT